MTNLDLAQQVCIRSLEEAHSLSVDIVKALDLQSNDEIGFEFTLKNQNGFTIRIDVSETKKGK